jgi:hypothetical protein
MEAGCTLNFFPSFFDEFCSDGLPPVDALFPFALQTTLTDIVLGDAVLTDYTSFVF